MNAGAEVSQQSITLPPPARQLPSQCILLLTFPQVNDASGCSHLFTKKHDSSDQAQILPCPWLEVSAVDRSQPRGYTAPCTRNRDALCAF